MGKLDLSRVDELFPPDAGASYTAPPTLTRRNDRTFDCSDPAAVVYFLAGNGYTPRPLCAPAIEYSRMKRVASLVVIYKSGAVVVQGRMDDSLALLGGLVGGGAK